MPRIVVEDSTSCLRTSKLTDTLEAAQDMQRLLRMAKERERGRVERGDPENRDDEQVAVRHADASGGDIRENQHEEKRVRDIQVSNRGSEAAREEHSDKWRKTERFEQEASNASASSDPLVALEYPASGETQDRPGSVLVQKSGHVDDDVQLSALRCILREG